MNRPQPKVLLLWRAALVAAAFFAAVLISVLFSAWSFAWIIAATVLAVIFIAAYTLYFPILYSRITYTLDNNGIFYTTGVFLRREIMIPISSIQYTAVAQNIFAKALGLSSVVVTAAGGRLVIPGLKTRDAVKLAEALDDR